MQVGLYAEELPDWYKVKYYFVKLERKATFLCIKAVPRIEKILGYELATFSLPCSAVICFVNELPNLSHQPLSMAHSQVQR